MRKLESLQAIARLGFLSDNVEDRVDKLGALGVVTLGPVVTGTALAKDKVVWSEDLAEWSGSDGVHENGQKQIRKAAKQREEAKRKGPKNTQNATSGQPFGLKFTCFLRSFRKKFDLSLDSIL